MRFLNPKIFLALLLLTRLTHAQSTVPTDCSEKNGYPLSPTTSQVVCPPYRQPVVFLVPHPDDETLGMGGAIAQAVKDGHTVIVELMTEGKASVFANGWKGGPDAFAKARLNEFSAAIKALGVTAVRINDYPDIQLKIENVETRIRFWTDQKIPSLRFVGTAGVSDESQHPDHIAVAHALVKARQPGTQWQMVYAYRAPNRSRRDDRTVISPAACLKKKDALAEYQKRDPQNQRYGIGWNMSVPDLFAGANSECAEYAFTNSGPNWIMEVGSVGTTRVDIDSILSTQVGVTRAVSDRQAEPAKAELGINSVPAYYHGYSTGVGIK